VKITELRLQANIDDALRVFYAGTLGLPIMEQPDNDDGLAVQCGRTKLVFEQGNANRYHFALNIPHNQYAEAKAWVSARADLVVFNDSDEVPFPAWEARSFYFYDPAGNILECITRYRLDNVTDEPFNRDSLLSISEIGMASTDVQATAQQICAAFGYTIFDGEGNDVFGVVGDDEGLFIIVKQGRIWFPETGIPAELYPVTVVVEHDKAVTFDVPGLPYRIVTN